MNITKWKAISRVVRGSAHIRDNKECQDAVFQKEEDGLVILAVADGHGSVKSPYSAKGAQLAVETAKEHLEKFYGYLKTSPNQDIKRHAEDNLPRKIVQDWSKKVKSDFESLNKLTEAEAADIKEESVDENSILVKYGSTLLSVIAAPEYILFLQLGDGDIITVDDNGEVRPISIKDDRLLANETTSLCTPNAWAEMRIRYMPIIENPPALIIISTDGYYNSFVTADDFLKAGKDFLDILKKDGPDYVKIHLEEWLNETSEKGSGDDITLAVIYREDLIDN